MKPCPYRLLRLSGMVAVGCLMMNIELVMGDQYIDLIGQGIDVAIRGGGELTSSSLRSRKLIDMKRVLCASPSYLKTAPALNSPDDLVNHTCLIYSLSSSPMHWVFKRNDEIKEVMLSQQKYVVNNGLALKQTVCLGHGIALLPNLFINDALKNKTLVEVLPDWNVDHHSLFAIYPFHKEQSHKIRTFIDFVVDHYANE